MGWFNPFEGSSGGGGGGGSVQEVICHSTSEWATFGADTSQYGMIYIYTDYIQEGGQNIAAMKVGDGITSITNLPFITTSGAVDPRISENDIQKWDNKVSAIITGADSDTLTLQTS